MFGNEGQSFQDERSRYYTSKKSIHIIGNITNQCASNGTLLSTILSYISFISSSARVFGILSIYLFMYLAKQNKCIYNNIILIFAIIRNILSLHLHKYKHAYIQYVLTKIEYYQPTACWGRHPVHFRLLFTFFVDQVARIVSCEFPT